MLVNIPNYKPKNVVTRMYFRRLQLIPGLVEKFYRAKSACRLSNRTTTDDEHPLKDIQFEKDRFQTLSEFFCLGQDEVMSAC
jgi:hypothetical protein